MERVIPSEHHSHVFADLTTSPIDLFMHESEVASPLTSSLVPFFHGIMFLTVAAAASSAKNFQTCLHHHCTLCQDHQEPQWSYARLRSTSTCKANSLFLSLSLSLCVSVPVSVSLCLWLWLSLSLSAHACAFFSLGMCHSLCWWLSGAWRQAVWSVSQSGVFVWEAGMVESVRVPWYHWLTLHVSCPPMVNYRPSEERKSISLISKWALSLQNVCLCVIFTLLCWWWCSGWFRETVKPAKRWDSPRTDQQCEPLLLVSVQCVCVCVCVCVVPFIATHYLSVQSMWLMEQLLEFTDTVGRLLLSEGLLVIQ